MSAELTRSEVFKYIAARQQLKLSGSGDELRGPCPIHHGERDSFAMNAETGEWFCHSECGRGGSLPGLEMALRGSTFPQACADISVIIGREILNGDAAGGWILDTYIYTDEEGAPLSRVVRTLDKHFYQQRPDGKGGWVNGIEGVRRVLYRLSKLRDAQRVLIVEGEKDVHALERLGFTATTNPMGAGKWRGEYSECLRGKDVAIVPDNDEPGRKHAHQVAQSLRGIAQSVVTITVAKGKDASDWITSGATRETFEEAWEQARRANGSATREPEWPEPQPLDASLPPVIPFSFALLPEVFRDFVEDSSERMQVPPDFIAAPLVAALSGAAGRRVQIQPKEFDTGWIVIPNTWGGAIGPSGVLKSPTQNLAVSPLTRIDRGLRKEYKSRAQEYAQTKLRIEALTQAWREMVKTAAKKGDPEPPPPELPEEPPPLQRLVANDCTPEALHQRLSENPAGLVYLRDELSGFLEELEKPGRENARAFFLEAWNGYGDFTIDRIIRGTVTAEDPCVTIIGGLTPARLRFYLADVLADKAANDGLLQRFQLLVWPDILADWELVDRVPRAGALDAVKAVFQRIVALDPAEPRELRFSPEAQELFNAWLTQLEHRIRSSEDHPALVSHLSKYRSLMPSLAGLFALVEDEIAIEIPLAAARLAAAWCVYLESHARRVYSCIVPPARQAAADLAQKLLAGKLGKTTFRVRDVYFKGWAGLDSPERARAALAVLVDADWIRAAPETERPGRPAEEFVLNPRLWEGKKS
jgi:5S rRNA maturation endonuclease (ribonuclease M5)